MNFKAVFVALFYVSAVIGQLPDCGGKINIRYEWRDLPRAEQEKYLNAVVNLHKAGKFEQFAKLHSDNFNNWHFSSMFFPVHRYFLYAYESALREIDSTIVFPYWDWSLDAAQPLQADIWKDFGSVVPDGKCVTDGSFANWQLSFPVNHCLTRNSTGNTFTLDTQESLFTLIQNASGYDQFRSTIENYPHSRVHVLIGGPNGNGDMVYAFSPNDPIFFMHHCYVDSLWNNYQLFDPSKRYTEYAGDANAAFPGFPNFKVSDVFETRNLCFVYAQPGTNYNGSTITNRLVSPPSPTPSPEPVKPPSPSTPPSPTPSPIQPPSPITPPTPSPNSSDSKSSNSTSNSNSTVPPSPQPSPSPKPGPSPSPQPSPFPAPPNPGPSPTPLPPSPSGNNSSPVPSPTPSGKDGNGTTPIPPPFDFQFSADQCKKIVAPVINNYVSPDGTINIPAAFHPVPKITIKMNETKQFHSSSSKSAPLQPLQGAYSTPSSDGFKTVSSCKTVLIALSGYVLFSLF